MTTTARIYTAPIQQRPVRDGGTLHRNGVTAVDRLAVPTVGAATAVTEAGSTLANSSMKYTVAAGTRWGVTTGAAVQSITPTANQAVRIPITQVTGADYYDIFLSTDAAPLWVGRITEAQRAAGGFIISTVGTVTAGGGAGAGAVDIGIVGTGVAWNVAPFNINTAWAVSSITPVDCTGRLLAKLLVQLSVTDLRSLPTLQVQVYTANQLSASDYFLLTSFNLAPLTTVNLPLEQDLTVEVDGTLGLIVVVSALSGQGAAVTVWVELV